ncbi:MAG: hypothetical protein M3P83_04300 [Actinomycetota bacterium]|nr:hypothetical protein [Actinomycetota bacterium]
MTRGKYAVKAANRMAELESEIIAELRDNLAAVTAERDAARRELFNLRVNLGTEVRLRAAELAATELQELRDLLNDERRRRESERGQLCEEVFAHLRHARMSLETATAIAVAFGQGHRIGQLWAANNNRMARRANAAKANWITNNHRPKQGKGPHVPRPMQ